MKKLLVFSLFLSLCSFYKLDSLLGEPTDKQIQAAKKKIAAHIDDLTKNGRLVAGNYGYVQGSIGDAFYVTDKTARLIPSGSCNHQFPLYEAKVVGYDAAKKEYLIGPASYQDKVVNNIKYWSRCTDSEFKMLNDLGTQLGGIIGIVNTKVTGKLLIVSENKICASCAGVIQGFKTMFPNIDCTIIDDINTRK
jgi:The  BURPS668_1122 family of deaminases